MRSHIYSNRFSVSRPATDSPQEMQRPTYGGPACYTVLERLPASEPSRTGFRNPGSYRATFVRLYLFSLPTVRLPAVINYVGQDRVMPFHNWAEVLPHLIIEVLSEGGDALRIQLVNLVGVVTPPQQQLGPCPVLVPTQPATLGGFPCPTAALIRWSNRAAPLRNDLRPANCGRLPWILQCRKCWKLGRQRSL